MKLKQKIHITLVGILVASGFVATSFAQTTLALNPTQLYVAQKCPQSTRGAEACAAAYNKELKKECGATKTTPKYRDCARKYAQDNNVQIRNNTCWDNCEVNVQTAGAPKSTGDGSDGATGTCGGVGTSIIKCDQDNSGDIESNAIWGLLLIAINILTAGIGLVAVGGIIYAAILYTTAQDKAAQVTKAKEVIFNVILGLVLFALMYAFLQFLIPGGVFQ